MKMFLLRIYDDYINITCRKNKKIFFCLVCFFVTGLVLGLFLGSSGLYSDKFFDDSINFTVLIFTNQISVWSIIFRSFFINLQYFVLIFLFSLSIYLLPLHFLFITYKGYVFGAAIIVFTKAMGLHGFSTVLIIVLPQQLILLFALSLYICATSYVTASYRKSFVCFSMHLKTCLVYFCLSLCNIVIELLIIYVIIKPFNILI